MTQEEIQTLYSQTDELLAIYERNCPITEDGFNSEMVKLTLEQMIDFTVQNAAEKQALLDWMETHDFYKSPASTRFHGNFESGLCVHTLQVIYQSLKFARPVLDDFFRSKFADRYSFSAKDIFIAALAHDFCKAGSYEISFRNTKDIFGNWTKKSYYKTRDDSRNLGHGNESVLILLEVMPSYIKNRIVIEAVSRHMGFSDLSDLERMNYSNFLTNPLVVLLQLADQTAAAWYEN